MSHPNVTCPRTLRRVRACFFVRARQQTRNFLFGTDGAERFVFRLRTRTSGPRMMILGVHVAPSMCMSRHAHDECNRMSGLLRRDNVSAIACQHRAGPCRIVRHAMSDGAIASACSASRWLGVKGAMCDLSLSGHSPTCMSSAPSCIRIDLLVPMESCARQNSFFSRAHNSIGTRRVNPR